MLVQGSVEDDAKELGFCNRRKPQLTGSGLSNLCAQIFSRFKQTSVSKLKFDLQFKINLDKQFNLFYIIERQSIMENFD